MKFAQLLSRDEMKHIMAGNGPVFPCMDGWDSCDCYKEDGEKLGSACCTGLNVQQCCQVSFPQATGMHCELAPPN